MATATYDASSKAGARFSFLSFAAIEAFSVSFWKGGFDPLTAMYEDIAISYRACRHGWLIKYEPAGIACHDASQ